MKHTNYFKLFLKETVDLNETRINSLEQSITAIKNVIEKSSFNDHLIDFSKQGSWAHKTIIKPLSGKVFDADLVVVLNPIPHWEASHYLEDLKNIFKNSHHHEDMLRLYSHCLTIEYLGDKKGNKKIDIAICIQRDFGLEICNKQNNTFEASYPQEYTNWVMEQNKIIGGNDLIKATRIIKFLRDHKGLFTMPSFLLTTLIGLHIYPADKENPDFNDTPTALKTIFNRINNFFQNNYYIPDINNPVNLNNNLKNLFGNQEQYENLKKCWSRYNNWINEAYIEEECDKSIQKWQKLLGEEFAKDYVLSKVLSANGNVINTTIEDLKVFGSINNNFNTGSKNATG